METRAEKKAKTRRSLIDAALRLSASRGFAALSLREITGEAGIVPNAFYRHFRTMDDLGLALVDEVALSLRQLMREARQQAALTSSRVETSVKTFVEFIRQNENHFRLLLGEKSGSSPAFRKAIQEEMSRFIDDLSEDLDKAAEAAKRPLIDAHLAAEAIVAIVFTLGAEVLELSPEKRKNLTERIIREVRLVLRGAETITPQELTRR